MNQQTQFYEWQAIVKDEFLNHDKQLYVFPFDQQIREIPTQVFRFSALSSTKEDLTKELALYVDYFESLELLEHGS